MKLASSDAALIAGSFLSARRAAKGLIDYPGDMPSSLDEAYAVQEGADWLVITIITRYF